MTSAKKRWLTRVGVTLTTLCAFGFGGYRWWRARTCTYGWSEAAAMLQSIRVAEEAYRAESGTYLGCDDRGAHTNGGDIATAPLHPRDVSELDSRKVGWGAGSTSLVRCLQMLHPRPDGPVRYAYAVVAHGEPEPWFEARAVGDPDGDGNRVEFRISSRSRSIDAVDQDD